RVIEKIEVNPINQNRNQENKLVPTENSSSLPTLEKKSEQRYEKYNLLRNRHLKQGRIEVISRESPKGYVVMVHSNLPCHVNIPPSQPHPFLIFDQIQALEVRHCYRQRDVAQDRRRLQFLEKWIVKRISRQGRPDSIEKEADVNYQNAHRSE